ncbi:hypothetical protein [Pseudomonas sp.]|uniref:hypothetical protein n=1 Tax=Pseudomonas sp. TaxID=306 RepID=UPI0026225129|nr:hypothetical protein [Pseudomonas sp.]
MVQQAVGPLPWGHNLLLITKLKKHRNLCAEQDKNRTLRREIQELRDKIASLASINDSSAEREQIA